MKAIEEYPFYIWKGVDILPSIFPLQNKGELVFYKKKLPVENPAQGDLFSSF